MKIYCTICCKEKRNDKEPIESINRYISERIKSIYEKSKKDAVEFRILSGKFGLLKLNEKIPNYDYQLFAKKVPEMVQIVCKQLSSQNIGKVIFFAGNPKLNPDWKPYINLIQKSCSNLDIFLEMKYIQESFE